MTQVNEIEKGLEILAKIIARKVMEECQAVLPRDCPIFREREITNFIQPQSDIGVFES